MKCKITPLCPECRIETTYLCSQGFPQWCGKCLDKILTGELSPINMKVGRNMGTKEIRP